MVEHMAARGLTAAGADRLVFEAPGDGPIRNATWRNRVWLPATKAAGLVGAGFDDLRGTTATVMVAAGVDIKTAQVQLPRALGRESTSIMRPSFTMTYRPSSSVDPPSQLVD